MFGTFVHMDFDCITPLGPARCRGMWVEGDATNWLTEIKATHEPWWWNNADFRFAPNVTDGGGPASPFGQPSHRLAPHIERYKKNSWL